MKRLTKVLVLIVALSTALNGTVFAALSDTVPVSVVIPLLGAASVDVTVRNISNDALAAPENLTFSLVGIDAAAPATYWRISSQYLKIVYSSTWNATWGMRVYTDNKTVYPTLVGKPIKTGPDNAWGTADDVLTYAGLVNTGKLDNPTLRVDLGWQVYTNKVAGNVPPATPASDDADFKSGTPADETDDWKSNWAYISDKSNVAAAAFNDVASYNDANANGKQDANEPTIYNYNLVAWGGIGPVGLAQHPAAAGNPPAAKAGDGDIPVYIAARFVSTDYTFDPDANFVLPAGNYATTVVLEMVYE